MVLVECGASRRAGPRFVGRWPAESSVVHPPLEPPPSFAVGDPARAIALTSRLFTLGRLGGTPGATVEAQSESSASTARASHGKPRRQHMAATLLHGPATTCRTVRTHNGQAEAVGALDGHRQDAG